MKQALTEETEILTGNLKRSLSKDVLSLEKKETFVAVNFKKIIYFAKKELNTDRIVADNLCFFVKVTRKCSA